MLYIVMGGIDCFPDNCVGEDIAGNWDNWVFETDLEEAEKTCKEFYRNEHCPFDTYQVWYWVERVVSITDGEGNPVPLNNIEAGDEPLKDWELEREPVLK